MVFLLEDNLLRGVHYFIRTHVDKHHFLDLGQIVLLVEVVDEEKDLECFSVIARLLGEIEGFSHPNAKGQDEALEKERYQKGASVVEKEVLADTINDSSEPDKEAGNDTEALSLLIRKGFSLQYESEIEANVSSTHGEEDPQRDLPELRPEVA